ncbi:hypothetical protein D3C79_775610 [compost metagenome]
MGQVTVGNLLGGFEGFVDGLDDAAGQQQRAEEGQHGCGNQQADHQREGRGILIGSGFVGCARLFCVDAHQGVHDLVDLLGVGQQVAVEQATQFIGAVGLAHAAHACFQLAVLVEQFGVLVEGGLFVSRADQWQVGLASTVDLGVALVQQVEGVALDFRFAVEQQAVGEGAQAQVERGQFVQGLDTGHADVFDGKARLADVAHLHEREDTKAEHEQADQGEPEQGARGDIHVA